ncbi:Hsp20 family protein [bacterium]|nr:Hsp20 family protein [bacterium]
MHNVGCSNSTERRSAMTLTRWKPSDSLLPTRFGSMFEDMMRQWWGDDEVVERVWAPRMDVHEDEAGYTIEADLPGMKRDDISITLEKGTLTLSGERKDERERKEGDRAMRERVYGSFSRSVYLGDRVEEKKIEAKFKDGVLHVHLPKAEKVKPKKIEIKAN